MHSARCGKLDGIDYALQIGASVDKKSDNTELTPLHVALTYKRLESVTNLVNLGANPHSLGGLGKEETSCLRWAIICGDLDCFAALLRSPKFDPALLVRRDFTIVARHPELATMRGIMATARKNAGLEAMPDA